MADNGRRKGDDALVLALAGGQTVRAAARAAGVGERTATRRVADPDFCGRVAELRAKIAERAEGKVVESMAEAAAGGHGEPAPAPPLLPSDDGGDLAREVVGAFGRLVRDYQEHLKTSLQEALDRIGDDSPDRVARALNAPPDQVSWIDLHAIAEADPEKSEARWREVIQAAREEVRSGHRAARAIEASGWGCWRRAQFLALRAELADAWRPRSQLEQQLIDQLAQFQTQMEGWQQVLTSYTSMRCETARQAARDGRPYEAPRLSEAEAVGQAAAMVQRFHRLFLQTLRALKDLRHVRPPAGLFGQVGQPRGAAETGRNGGPVLN